MGAEGGSSPGAFSLIGGNLLSNVGNMQIRGKMIFITGAAKRVGRAIALRLAGEGAVLLLHYHRSEKEAHSLQAEIRRKYKTKAFLLQGDLSRVADLKRISEEAWSQPRRVDVLVNNASTFYSTPLGRTTEKNWEDLFNVNARAPYFLCESLGLKMKRRGNGKIINIADWAALRPYTQYVPYCASKAALVAISQGMAKSLAPQVQVNTILPGPVLWPKELGEQVKRQVIKKTPLAKIGSPEDIANAVKYLIEGSDFMTGSLLHVDGGRSIA